MNNHVSRQYVRSDKQNCVFSKSSEWSKLLSHLSRHGIYIIFMLALLFCLFVFRNKVSLMVIVIYADYVNSQL